MKIILKAPFKDNIAGMMRKIGYSYRGKKEDTGEIEILRPIGGGGYPRFHVFIRVSEDEMAFNLHLDQKKPSYKGTSAHSGEYDGVVVEKEAERIKQLLQ